jgi:hypothetical protein
MNKYTRKKNANHHKYAKIKTKTRDKSRAKSRNKAKTKKLYYKGGGKEEEAKRIAEAITLAEQAAIQYWNKNNFGLVIDDDEIAKIIELFNRHYTIIAPARADEVRPICNHLKSIVPKFKQPDFIPGSIDKSGAMVFIDQTTYKYNTLACASFLLLGIIAHKMFNTDSCPYKLIFKGGKALQLHGINHESKDIDVLLLPKYSRKYHDESKKAELAKNIAYLIKIIINKSSFDKDLGEFSVLDKDISQSSRSIKNEFIYKISWLSKTAPFDAVIDIDYKEIDSESMTKFYSTFKQTQGVIDNMDVKFEYPTLNLILDEKNHYFEYYTSLNYYTQLFINLVIYSYITLDQFIYKFQTNKDRSSDLFTYLRGFYIPSVKMNPVKFDEWLTDFKERGNPMLLQNYIYDNQYFLDKFQRSITSIRMYLASMQFKKTTSLPPTEPPLPPTQPPLPPLPLPIQLSSVETPSVKLEEENDKPAVNMPISWATRVINGVQTTRPSDVIISPRSEVLSTPKTKSSQHSSANPSKQTPRSKRK